MRAIELILKLEICCFLIVSITYFSFSNEIGTYIAINIDSIFFMTTEEIAMLFKESNSNFNGFDLMAMALPRALAVIAGWILVIGVFLYIYDFIKYLDKRLKTENTLFNIKKRKVEK